MPLETDAISRDPAAVEAYRADPLVYHGRIHARTGAEIMRATALIQHAMEREHMPLLIIHGTADRLCDPRGSQDLYSRAQSKDKTLNLYDNAYHELLNDLDKKKVLADLLDWLAHRS